jgi:hypothetical protein
MSHLSGKMEEDKRKRHPGVIAGFRGGILYHLRGAKKGQKRGKNFK